MKKTFLALLAALALVAPALSQTCPSVNLLVATEEVDSSAWTKTASAVYANTDQAPDCNATADHIYSVSSFAAIRQTSAVAASSGGGTALFYDAALTWQRYSVAASFDGSPFTCSAWIKEDEEEVAVRLRLDLDGGYIRCSIEDPYTTSYAVWGFQLEPGTSPTTYVRRTP